MKKKPAFICVYLRPRFLGCGRRPRYEVAHQFVRDAARLLRRGGRFFLVANRFLRYADLIRETFGEVNVAYADSRYHVLTAVARKPSSG